MVRKNYKTDTDTDNPNNVTSSTLETPTSSASNISFSSVNYQTMTANWSNGNGHARIVFMGDVDVVGESGSASPVDETTYIANADFWEWNTDWFKWLVCSLQRNRDYG
jgi:hypothetical protein